MSMRQLQRDASANSRRGRAFGLTISILVASALSCVGRNAVPDDTSALTVTEVDSVFAVALQLWDVAKSRDSIAIRRLSTSDQPLAYFRGIWGPDGVFASLPSRGAIIDAYRATSIPDTVFLVVETNMRRCPDIVPDSAKAAAVLSLLNVPPWRIARFDIEPC